MIGNNNEGRREKKNDKVLTEMGDCVTASATPVRNQGTETERRGEIKR